MLEKVKVEEAVGNVLGHDITRIDPGRFKGVAFAQGHVVCPEDIPELLNLGKEHIYVWRETGGLVHENEAARRLALAVAGDGIALTSPREGRVNLQASCDGLLQVDVSCLARINARQDVSLATRLDDTPVKQGEIVAAAKVVPLAVPEPVLQEIAMTRPAEGIVRVQPYRVMQAGVIVTGNEVYYGRIPDAFGQVVEEKLAGYGCRVQEVRFTPDVPEAIACAIHDLRAAGCQMLLVTGGMAVDADDVTPTGIRQTGAEVITYGAPVAPGFMLLLAYLGDVPILGLPGCVMHDKVTSFDLVLPRLLAGEKLTRSDLIRWGHGGLCLKCQECRYPNCAFGKG